MLQHNIFNNIFIVLFVLTLKGDLTSAVHTVVCDKNCFKYVGDNNEENPERIMITSVALNNGTPIVATPRFYDDLIATVATVELNSNGKCTGQLKPYPSLAYNNKGCKGIQNAVSVRVDCCRRLWIMDSGLSADGKNGCRPKVIIIRLKDNQVLGSYEVPKEILYCRNLFASFAVEINNGECDKAVAYIGDLAGKRLYVFDLERAIKKKEPYFWYFLNEEFYPYPEYGLIKIGDASQVIMDGISALALGPREYKCGDRWVYFHSVASPYECFISASFLSNYSNSMGPIDSTADYVKCSYKPRTQSGGQDMTNNGIMFFGLLKDKAIACWNNRYVYQPENLNTVLKDDKFKFTGSIKIDEGGECDACDGKQNVIILSAAILEYLGNNNTNDCSKKNFYIITAPADKLAAQGGC